MGVLARIFGGGPEIPQSLSTGTLESPGVPTEVPDYGPNNEQLPLELQRALWELTTELERQDELSRRREVRAILQRRLFFRGEQYWWYSEYQGLWFPPYERPPNLEEQEEPTFQHVTNIIQPYLLSLATIISQNMVQAQFWPQSVQNEVDKSTARNASKVAELIHRQNDLQRKSDDASYWLGTDGFLGGYVRYVTDGQRFGYYPEENELAEGQTEVSPPAYQCPDCGNRLSDEGIGICPDCGGGMQQVPAESAPVPQLVGTRRSPRGQEVIDIVPALNLKRSMWADEQPEFLYLTWITDLHKSKAKALHPLVEKKIDGAGGGAGGDAGSTDYYEKLARRLLYVGTGRYTGATSKDLGTYRRTWLRPESFRHFPAKASPDAEDGIREKLLELFPDGANVTFWEDVYCESRNRSMDECWETVHGMPGEGQFRETLISALIPIQEQVNDASNLIFEIGMYGVPEGFADKDIVDFEARNKQAALPGQLSPVTTGAGDIRAKMMFTQATEPSVALVRYREELITTLSQFISGAFPALYGGDTGQNDTLGGITIQRNQALGRVGRVWRRMQIFWANLDAKAVRCFAKSRPRDVELPSKSDSGDFQSDWLRLEELRGDIVAYPEVDQQYPVLQAQLHGLIQGLFESGNPAFMSLLPEGDNLEYVLDRIGLTDIEKPGQAQKIKTHRDIEQLLDGQPMESPPDPNELPGAPPRMVPTIRPDPLVDNLPLALDTARRWLISEVGQQAKVDNPTGYINVRLYAEAAEQMQKAKEFQQAVAAQGIRGQGPAQDLGGAQDVGQSPGQEIEPQASSEGAS